MKSIQKFVHFTTVLLFVLAITMAFGCGSDSDDKNDRSQASKQTQQTTPANPGIVVTLDQVGVISDHDPLVQGKGEIYLGVVVTDGVEYIVTEVPPRTNDPSHFSLNDNETHAVNTEIFRTDSVGDYLTIAIISYESDGDDEYQDLVYEGLAIAAQTAIRSQTAGIDIIALLDIDLKDLLKEFTGATDDMVGSYENTWTNNTSWGVGTYSDITSDDLRLWFTIESL